MDWIKQKVDRLFKELNAARGDFCHNPITGTSFVWGDDPIEPQKGTPAGRCSLAKSSPSAHH